MLESKVMATLRLQNTKQRALCPFLAHSYKGEGDVRSHLIDEYQPTGTDGASDHHLPGCSLPLVSFQRRPGHRGEQGLSSYFDVPIETKAE
jgi:hypothetical protein